MPYGALYTVINAYVEHAREAISDVSNVGLLNWEHQSLTCHFSRSIRHCMLYMFDVVSPTCIILNVSVGVILIVELN